MVPWIRNETGLARGGSLTGKQLIKSSGSVGANYIEANESLGKKDFSYSDFHLV